MNTQDMLSRLGITQLSEMQENASLAILHNKHVVLLAPTGSGKTLAFLLPLLQLLQLKDPGPQALVLSPTRELAEQTFSVLQRLKTSFAACCLHGGRPAMEEHRLLKALQPQILVGTPGRLNDHIDKENFSTRHIHVLIVDEFDKMLELKFQDELERLVNRLPKADRCILVSATPAKEIPAFIGFRKSHPIELNYLNEERATIPAAIHHYAVHSPSKDKLTTLHHLLCQLGEQQAVVFLAYRESVERTWDFLKTQGHSCVRFHGGLTQEERERALYAFSAGAASVLVSTDLSARGLDIPQLQNVVHYHLPLRHEDYVHRCGRTGRWDAKGKSFLLLGPDEQLPEFDEIPFTEFPLSGNPTPPKPPAWSMLYIGKGKRDKISRADVVGFLCKQGGVRAEDIGRIDLHVRYTYACIRRTRYRQVISLCNGEKIKKMKTLVQPMHD